MSEPKSTTGQLVIVETLRLGGGSPMRVPVVVAEPDATKAMLLVTAKLLPGDSVKLAYPLPQGCIEAMDLEPGEFSAWLGGGLR